MNAMHGETAFAYHLMKATVDLYGKGPAHLDARQRAKAATRARKSLALERSALAADEGKAIIIPESQIDAAFAEIKGRYESEEAFEQDLTLSGLTPTALRQGLHQDLRFDALLTAVTASVPPPSESDMRIFYEENMDRFQKPETRTVRHILITVNDAYTDNKQSVSWARATALVSTLQEDGSTFERLARDWSECPTALQGGTLGTVPKGTLFPALDAQLFTMAAGEIAGPVETELGYHVLWCEAIYPAQTLTFDDVRDRLADALTDRARRAAQKAWLGEVGALAAAEVAA
ncbi:MAG: nitrogen fixation protein NifM [Magnetospiraceae bacterium]